MSLNLTTTSLRLIQILGDFKKLGKAFHSRISEGWTFTREHPGCPGRVEVAMRNHKRATFLVLKLTSTSTLTEKRTPLSSIFNILRRFLELVRQRCQSYILLSFLSFHFYDYIFMLQKYYLLVAYVEWILCNQRQFAKNSSKTVDRPS